MADQTAHDGLRVWLLRTDKADPGGLVLTLQDEADFWSQRDYVEVVEVMPVSEHARRLAERQDQHRREVDELGRELARSEERTGRVCELVSSALGSLFSTEPPRDGYAAGALADALRLLAEGPDETAGGGRTAGEEPVAERLGRGLTTTGVPEPGRLVTTPSDTPSPADHLDREGRIWRVRERLAEMEGTLGAAADGSDAALYALAEAALTASVPVGERPQENLDAEGSGPTFGPDSWNGQSGASCTEGGAASERAALLSSIEGLLCAYARLATDGDDHDTAVHALGWWEQATGDQHEYRGVILDGDEYGEV